MHTMNAFIMATMYSLSGSFV